MTDMDTITRQARTIAALEARVAELEAALNAARRAATHDPLTGLLNRAGLAEAWMRGPRPPAELAVVDLDDFKPVNDRHGHAAGDVVLVAVAEHLRRLPMATRLGGDEFAALVGPGDSLPTSVAVTLPTGVIVWVTWSIGLAPAVGDLRDALGHADAAMYRAKRSARPVAVYDPAQDGRRIEDRPLVRLRDRVAAGEQNDLRGAA